MQNKLSTKLAVNSSVIRLANRYGVEPERLLNCLVTQVFKQSDGTQPSNEELMVLMLVCQNYDLNPFNREIFAFRGKGGDIVPVVSLDGWAKIVRGQKDFNGMSFTFSESSIRVPGVSGDLPEFVECAIRLKGIDEPVRVQEYMAECFNEKSAVWKKWPRRMLRTRAFIQCARLAFSLTGLYDEGEPLVAGVDDAIEGTAVSVPQPPVKKEIEPLGKERLATMIGKLVYCAVNRENGFERAREWIEGNLAECDKAEALNAINAKEKELTVPENVDEETGEILSSESEGGAS